MVVKLKKKQAEKSNKMNRKMPRHTLIHTHWIIALNLFFDKVYSFDTEKLLWSRHKEKKKKIKRRKMLKWKKLSKETNDLLSWERRWVKYYIVNECLIIFRMSTPVTTQFKWNRKFNRNKRKKSNSFVPWMPWIVNNNRERWIL